MSAASVYGICCIPVSHRIHGKFLLATIVFLGSMYVYVILQDDTQFPDFQGAPFFGYHITWRLDFCGTPAVLRATPRLLFTGHEVKVVTTAAMSSFTCGQPQQNGSFFRIKRRETIFLFWKNDSNQNIRWCLSFAEKSRKIWKNLIRFSILLCPRFKGLPKNWWHQLNKLNLHLFPKIINLESKWKI